MTKDEQAGLRDRILIFFCSTYRRISAFFFNAIKIETTLKPVHYIDQRNVDFFWKTLLCPTKGLISCDYYQSPRGETSENENNSNKKQSPEILTDLFV